MPGSSVGAILPVLLVGDVFAVAWYRRHADWGRLLRLLPYVVAGMVPGVVVLLVLLEGNELRPVIGCARAGACWCSKSAGNAFGWEHCRIAGGSRPCWVCWPASATFVANAAMP